MIVNVLALKHSLLKAFFGAVAVQLLMAGCTDNASNRPQTSPKTAEPTLTQVKPEGTAKPDQALVETLARGLAEGSVPSEWGASGGKYGRLVETHDVSAKIIEWGEYNVEKKYWPVKVMVQGRGTGRSLEKGAFLEPFGVSLTLYMYQDDFKKWKVKEAGFERVSIPTQTVPAGQGTAATRLTLADYVGKWEGTSEIGGRFRIYHLEIKLDGQKVTGVARSFLNKSVSTAYSIEGTLVEGALKFKGVAFIDGDTAYTCLPSATVTGRRYDGATYLDGPWTVSRSTGCPQDLSGTFQLTRVE